MLKELLQGRFARHPLHPMLVHLPIGLWLASVIFDVIYLWSPGPGRGNPNLPHASYPCILLGLVGALIAAPAGLAELIEIPQRTRARRIALAHLALNVVVIALFAASAWLRRLAPDGLPWPAVALSLVALAALLVSGYLGGLLVYEYGIGFRPQNRDKPKPDLRRVA